MSEEPNNNDLVVVEWHGRKIFIKKEKLDEWHGMKSEEQKVDYVNSHPEVRQGEPVSVHRMNRVRALQEDDDLVMVHWSGNKVRRRSTTVDWLFSRVR